MNKNGNIFRNIVLITQLSINVMVPTFLCLFLGIWIDGKFNTSTAVPLMILGILGGGKSAYTMAMNAITGEKKHQESPEEIVARINREKESKKE